ncbi:hypothetical protein WN943_029311 [Citrus x changshan-huyou]
MDSVHLCLCKLLWLIITRIRINFLNREGCLMNDSKRYLSEDLRSSSSRRLFDEMPERKFATWNTMIDAYARLAELLFNKMPAWDIRSWTTMITSYSQNKQFREALDAFNKTKKSGTGSDQVTMATVLSACAHLGALDLGRGIQIYLREKNLLCWNSITEALAIHGFAHEALGLVGEGGRRSLSMTCGCKLYGNLEIAHIAVNELMGFGAK